MTPPSRAEGERRWAIHRGQRSASISGPYTEGWIEVVPASALLAAQEERDAFREKVLEAREDRDEARAKANRHLRNLQFIEKGEDRTDRLIDRAEAAEQQVAELKEALRGLLQAVDALDFDSIGALGRPLLTKAQREARAALTNEAKPK